MLKVGILQVYLEIPWAQSLKDKRSVLRSIKDKTRRNFNVSIAEFGDQDTATAASLGLVMAGNDTKYILGALEKLKLSLMDWPEANLVDSQVEVI
jgi:uncharacterized protein YlxP (DUF503 family)